MKRLIFILPPLLVLMACSKPKEKEKISFIDSLNIAYEGRVFNSHKDAMNSDTLDGSFVVIMNVDNKARYDSVALRTIEFAPGVSLSFAPGEKNNEALYIYTVEKEYAPVVVKNDSVYVITSRKGPVVFAPYCATKRDPETDEIIDCYGLCRNCLLGPAICYCDDPKPKPEPWPQLQLGTRLGLIEFRLPMLQFQSYSI